jgi:hypothetical protein
MGAAVAGFTALPGGFGLGQDVGPKTHCFSVVPESLTAKRALRLQPNASGATIVAGYEAGDQWRTVPRADGVDVHAPAGSVVIVNNTNFHAATVRLSIDEKGVFLRAPLYCIG